MSEPDDQAVSWERSARYLAGECDPAEAEAFERWLAENPARAREFEQLRALVDRAALAAPTGEDVEAALARVHQRMDQEPVRAIESAPHRPAPRRPLWQSPPMRVAATVTLLVGGALLYRALATPGGAGLPVAARTYQTPVGRADTIQLADGSTVVLAPASRLVVAAGYGENERSVALQGVAWFEVRHDQRRVFSVRAGDALVTDLGTAFTVRADPAQPVTVTVTDGAVRLTSNVATATGVIISAGERGTLVGDVATTDPGGPADAAVAWTRGRLVFAEAPFPQVAAELRRWYGVELVAGDAVIAARHLTSEFEGEAVTDVIAVIALALDARTEVRGDTIVLRSVP